MKQRPTRREFLSLAAGAAAAVVLGPAGAGCAPRSAVSETDATNWFAVDPRKCIGCGACVRACREEHGTPSGVTRTWIERHRADNGGEISIESPAGGENGFEITGIHQAESGAIFLPKLCNQCSHPPCVQYCPVGAMFQTPDGFVLTDTRRCIGCALCIKACPFGARFKDPVAGISGGCDWCHRRATRGMNPVCVHVCPTQARVFGRRVSGEAGMPDWLSRGAALYLEPQTGTGARVAYAILDPKGID
ncbi:MAG: 4Fe-4S dicluster domain-containing protein [Planctomycetota bacterium]|jgi:Fe-S-cluster-containing dehydrogenase component